jgi:Protein of unknown function (DUF3237)
MIQFVHVADLTIQIAGAIEIGPRRVIPITGGEAHGPKLRGRILPAGADFQVLRRDGVTELHARYVLETDGGALVYIENSGMRHGPADAMEKLRRGELVDPALIYFRTTPRFETVAESQPWLTRHVFVGDGVRRPDRVELAIYQVM